MGKRRRSSILIDPTARRDYLLNKSSFPGWNRGGAQSLDEFGPSFGAGDPDQKRNRLLTGFRGRGAYFGDHSKSWYGKTIAMGLRGAGGALGGYFGNAGLGAGLGAAASKWAGFGKYKRRNFRGRGDYAGDAGGNQIMAGSVSTPITVNSSEDNLSGDVNIAHREFLGNVFALSAGGGLPSAFSVVDYAINPGLLQSFPWLSQIATNFSLYDLIGCIFEYRPTSGELGSASNQLGKVIMATQYDPDAADFINSVQMENYDYSTACKPSQAMMHGVETDPKQRATQMLYIRTGPSVKDKILTDIGVFQIATEGLPIGAAVAAGIQVPIGELWVTYKVRLSRAFLQGSYLGNNVPRDEFFGTSSAALWAGNSLTTVPASPSALKYPILAGLTTSNLVPNKFNNIGGTVTATGATITYTFPANIVSGSYQLSLLMVLAGVGVNAIASAAVLNCTGTTNAKEPFPTESIASTAAENAARGQIYVTVNAPGTLLATVIFTPSIAIITGATLVLQVTQMPTNFLI
uniref:Capsid protein n=1 Tax=Crucivirus-like circular genetic element-471 TaxID=2761502 RepID=A0A7G5M439_9VIRU|nr:capsid protein [Crucivirus-like circular genetic element-471]